mgnify:FL=1
MDKNQSDSDSHVDDAQIEGPDADADPNKQLEALTDKWKRALAEAENARKRADLARMDGHDHGVAIGVEALAPAYDAVFRAIEAAHASPDTDTPQMSAHLAGLKNIKTAFETGLKALGVRTIAPKNTPFDPMLHEAMQIKETDKTAAGEVLILHRPGLVLGKRLIRPAHVTVSASPGKPAKEKSPAD